MVRIELMCHFVEKVLNLNNVCGSGPKSSQKNCPVMPYACVKNSRSISRAINISRYYSVNKKRVKQIYKSQ